MICPTCHGARYGVTQVGPDTWERTGCQTCAGTGTVSDAHAGEMGGDLTEDGGAAFRALAASRHYAHLDLLTLPAEVAARLVLPPIAEGTERVQFMRPMPAARVAWLAGFTRAQRAAMAALVDAPA